LSSAQQAADTFSQTHDKIKDQKYPNLTTQSHILIIKNDEKKVTDQNNVVSLPN
jgi:hypothetical protein